ncbi:hypothetical protein [Acinetobacter guillouiae]|uniref:hypothetical protein n=1 Tax=Acinetobacter guillouiae TaxID=106649 RepID=UPI003AF74334
MSGKLSLEAEELAKFALKGDKANRLLIGHLVKFLSDKGVIDLEDYLSSVTEFKEHALDLLESENEAELIELAFDLHLNDFSERK